LKTSEAISVTHINNNPGPCREKLGVAINIIAVGLRRAVSDILRQWRRDVA
jgi:hypothetical protein